MRDRSSDKAVRGLAYLGIPFTPEQVKGMRFNWQWTALTPAVFEELMGHPV